MRRIALLVVGLQAALVAAFAFALGSRKIPLGVPGEWEWQRVNASPETLSVSFAVVGILLFATVVGAGFRSVSRSTGPKREGIWLAILVVSAILTQWVVQEGAPVGFGLSKWIFALYPPGSSGYYTVARQQMKDPRRFLADYPAWIEKQDALHIGTHPPGLFVVAKGMLNAMEANPDLSRQIIEIAPSSVSKAFVAFRETDGLSRTDAAGLALTGFLTLIFCSLTVVPLYWLARSFLPAPGAWASAAFWPLVPAALMFQPAADTAFPLLSTTALALASWAGKRRPMFGLTLVLLAGGTLAVGMFFTLAFLPVGLVVGLVLVTSPALTWVKKGQLILATGVGFLLGTLAWWWATSANPLAIWWVNQRNHARFYAEYPRSYLAWMIENPIELVIALGIPATIWGLVSLRFPRQIPRVSWLTALVLVILTISGKNLSEVARLWLPLMPPLLVATGWGFTKLGSRGWELAVSVTLVGLQVLILEAAIQVVYPI